MSKFFAVWNFRCTVVIHTTNVCVEGVLSAKLVTKLVQDYFEDWIR